MKNVKMHCLNPFRSSIVDFTGESRRNNVIFSLFANVSEQQKNIHPVSQNNCQRNHKGVVDRVALA